MIAFFDDLPGFAGWKAQWPGWYWIEGLTTYQGAGFTPFPPKSLTPRLIYNKDLFRQAGLDPERPPRSYREVGSCQKLPRGKAWPTALPTWRGLLAPGVDAQPMGGGQRRPGLLGLEERPLGHGRIPEGFQLILEMKEDGSLFPGAATPHQRCAPGPVRPGPDRHVHG